MNLFELFVKIGVDDQASGKLGKIANKLGSGLKTAAKIGTAAVGVASAGITALTTKAVKNYAEYEQLVGGVDTLFKNSSKKVQEYAASAFRTAGMSSNEYMATVTSFSASLLQSLGGDTEKAAEYADLAITDMSDNANKMGTSMELIQNAYQGFAKDNYTMLDNLKLGYGGTKTEMERLIKDAAKLDKSIDANDTSFGNIVKSINAVQTELGITGTTAKEAASTISGSVSSMKSAWSNLVSGIANKNSDFDKLVDNFVESTSTVFDNLLPRIETSLNGVAKLITKLAPKIASVLPKLAKSVIPAIIKSAGNVITELAKALPDLLESVTDAMMEFLDGLIDNLPEIVSSLSKTVIALFKSLVKLAPKLIEAAGELIGELVEALPELLEELATAVVEAIPELLSAIGKAATNIAQSFLNIFTDTDEKIEESLERAKTNTERVINEIEPFFERASKNMTGLFDVDKMVSSSGNTISEIEGQIKDTEDKITEIIKNAVKSQNGLREDDLENIRKYQLQLQELQSEKVSVYLQKQASILTRAGFLTSGDEAGGAKLAAEANKAKEDALSAVAEIANSRLATLESIYSTEALKGSKEYKKEIKKVQDWEKEQNEAIRNSYGKTINEINNVTIELTESSKKAFEAFKELGDTFQGYDPDALMVINLPELQEVTAGSIKSVKELANSFGIFVDDTTTVGEVYSKILEKMELDTSGAFLAMALSASENGQKLDKKTEETALAMIEAFSNVPDAFKDTAKQALLRMISGMEEQIPGLKNASEMSVDEIVSVLKGRLTKAQFEGYGKNITTGLEEGIKSGISGIKGAVSGAAFAISNQFKKDMGINSPSKLFKKFGNYLAEGLSIGWEDGLDKFGISDGGFDVQVGDGGSGYSGVSVVQNIYSEAKSAADLMEEAMYFQERAVYIGV